MTATRSSTPNSQAPARPAPAHPATADLPPGLVLTRGAGEAVIIRVPGRRDPIRITVGEIRRSDKIRLCFQASREITIHREEVDAQIQADKQAAGQEAA